MKFGHVAYLRYASGQTDRNTDIGLQIAVPRTSSRGRSKSSN